MKKTFLFVYYVLFYILNSYSQYCLESGIIISNQKQIDDFPSLYPDCSEILGPVIISGEEITNLYGLSGITKLHSSLSIIENDKLINLEGLHNVETICGDLGICCNPKLINFNGLSDLKIIEGSLSVENNNNLIDLSGLENLYLIEQHFFVNDNNSLRNFNGLNSLERIVGVFDLSNNNSLENFIGLENLKYIDMWSEIINNDSLINFEGLESLERIGGSLIIGYYSNGNKTLKNLNGLNNLTFLDGNLKIDDNPKLLNLSGLTKLNTLNGYLAVVNNTSIVDIAGLANIDPNSIKALYLTDNSSLCNCAVRSICEYLDIPNASFYILNNSLGCNEKEEIQDDCEDLSIEIIKNMPSCELFVNSISNQLEITVEDNFHVREIRIFNLLSELLYSERGSIHEVNLDFLQQGIYIVECDIEGVKIRKRFLKNFY